MYEKLFTIWHWKEMALTVKMQYCIIYTSNLGSKYDLIDLMVFEMGLNKWQTNVLVTAADGKSCLKS